MRGVLYTSALHRPTVPTGSDGATPLVRPLGRTLRTPKGSDVVRSMAASIELEANRSNAVFTPVAHARWWIQSLVTRVHMLRPPGYVQRDGCDGMEVGSLPGRK